MPSISRFLSRVFNPPPSAGQPPRGFSDWTIAGVRFAQDGLSADTASETCMTWTAEDCEVELTQSAHDGIIRPVDPVDVEQFRNEQRRIAIENGRGLVSADVLTTRGIRLLEVITKARAGMGCDYVGTITGTGAHRTYTVPLCTDVFSRRATLHGQKPSATERSRLSGSILRRTSCFWSVPVRQLSTVRRAGFDPLPPGASSRRKLPLGWELEAGG